MALKSFHLIKFVDFRVVWGELLRFEQRHDGDHQEAAAQARQIPVSRASVKTARARASHPRQSSPRHCGSSLSLPLVVWLTCCPVSGGEGGQELATPSSLVDAARITTSDSAGCNTMTMM